MDSLYRIQSFYPPSSPHLHLSPPLGSLSSKLSFFHTSRASIITNSLIKPTSNLSIVSAQNPKPIDSPHEKTTAGTILCFIKPVLSTLAAAACIHFAIFRKPSSFLSFAAVPVSSPLSEPLPFSGEEDTESNLSDDEKERILESRLQSNPNDALSLQALMELKVKTRQLDDAIAIVDRLVVLDPADKELPLLKAHLQNYAGNSVAAKAGFEEIIRKDPLVVEAYHGLVMLAAQSEESGNSNGELDDVVERIELAMENCKKENNKEEMRDFSLLVAQVQVMAGEYEKALEIYRGLEREEPNDFRPYLCQGIIYTLLQKKDEAERLFEKYRTLVPKEHPYSQYFDENMATMMAFGQMKENRRSGGLKR